MIVQLDDNWLGRLIVIGGLVMLAATVGILFFS
jgi:hypothetical protein